MLPRPRSAAGAPCSFVQEMPFVIGNTCRMAGSHASLFGSGRSSHRHVHLRMQDVGRSVTLQESYSSIHWTTHPKPYTQSPIPQALYPKPYTSYTLSARSRTCGPWDAGIYRFRAPLPRHLLSDSRETRISLGIVPFFSITSAP